MEIEALAVTLIGSNKPSWTPESSEATEPMETQWKIDINSKGKSRGKWITK
jgi:hypothetical protein